MVPLSGECVLKSRTTTLHAIFIHMMYPFLMCRRSDGSWAYSLVVDRLCEEGNEEVLKLQVNSRGSTKSVTLSKARKFIRRVKHNGAGMSEESAQAIFQAMRFDEGRKL